MSLSVVRSIQRLFPRIYVACHVDHVRRRSSDVALSSYDSAILAHLDPKASITATKLAGHLGVSVSTLSAAISRLTRLGFVVSTPYPGDRRLKSLRLTVKGDRAMGHSSVLDATRLRKIIAKLSAHEQKKVVQGLALLAGASGKVTVKIP